MVLCDLHLDVLSSDYLLNSLNGAFLVDFYRHVETTALWTTQPASDGVVKISLRDESTSSQ